MGQRTSGLELPMPYREPHAVGHGRIGDMFQLKGIGECYKIYATYVHIYIYM